MNTEQDQRTQERERAELHKTIWGIADRGAVSGWDFKQYVLGTLFYRFLSEKIARVADEEQRAAGDAGFSYAALPDEDALPAKDILVRKIGFFLRPSHLFFRVHAAAASRVCTASSAAISPGVTASKSSSASYSRTGI